MNPALYWFEQMAWFSPVRNLSTFRSELVLGLFCLAQFLSWAYLPSVGSVIPAARSVPAQDVLPNGLKVILLEDRSFPVVSTSMWYHAGARNESIGATGMCHLVEHLLFGTVGNFKKGELGETIARNGGQFNGYTSDDFTAFFESLPSSKLEMALRIESERMRGATFTGADVKDEVARILTEFDEQNKNAVDSLSREVRVTAYQHHPYHNPTMGWRSDVESLTVSQARAFYDRFYRPDNATLVIVGDFRTQPTLALVRKYFGGIAKGQDAAPAVTSVEPQQKGERRVVVKYLGKQEVLEVAYHAPAISEADAAAMAVIEKLLNTAYAGRLKSKLVNTRVCSSAQSVFESKRDPGLFTITCMAAPGSGQQKILDALDGMLNQLKSQPIADAELRRSRTQAEFAFVGERDGPYKAGFDLGYFDSVSTWQNSYTWMERLQSVTSADIQRAARRYFSTDNRVVGWLSSPNAPKPPAAKPSGDSQKDIPKSAPQREAFRHLPLVGYKANDKAIVTRTFVVQQLPQAEQAKKVDVPAAQARPEPSAQVRETQAVKESLMPEPAPVNIQQKVLSNGIKLVLFETHMSPVVQIFGAVKAGSAFEPSSKKGLSELIAAVLSAGSAKHSHLQTIAMQEDMGLTPPAMLRFESNSAAIEFRSKCLSRDLSGQLTLLAESLMTPALQESDIDKSKLEAIASIRRAEEAASTRVERALWQSILAPGSPYYPIEPALRIKSIGNLKAPDVKGFFDQFVKPDATTIVICGDASLNQTAELMERVFSAWSGKSVEKKLAAQINAKRILRTSIPISDKTESIISLGQLVQFSRHHADYGSLLLANCLLTEHPVLSRLGLSFIAEPSLANVVDSEDVVSKVEALGDSTAWSLSVSISPSAVSPAVKVITSETRKLAKSGASAEELSEAKRYLLGAVPVKYFGTLPEAGQGIVNSILQDGEADYLPKLLSSIRSATVDSVNKFIQTSLKPDQACLVVAGNRDALREARKQVSADASRPGVRNASSPDARSTH